MKPFSPPANETLVYTNFYLNSTWGDKVPVPLDNTTWSGVTRRDNLLNLSSQDNNFNLTSMQKLMEVPLDEGGAFWDLTIYQIIFQPESNTISLRRSFEMPNSWVDIDLNEFYKPLQGSSIDLHFMDDL
jgi:hypothetical protein